MDDRKGDRSDKRYGERSTNEVDKSSSDSELTRGSKAVGRGRHKVRIKKRPSFLDGLSVDELARYRRRRVPGQPKDTLGIPDPEDIDSYLCTEYRLSFRASSDDVRRDNTVQLRPEKTSSFDNLPKLKSSTEELERENGIDNSKEYEKVNAVNNACPDPNAPKNESPDVVIPEITGLEEKENLDSEQKTEDNPNPAALTNVQSSSPIKGSMSHRVGEFYGNTEYSVYVPHEGRHRPDLARRPTALRMEGNMNTRTEKCDQFVEWPNVTRPDPVRLTSHLRLEGALETSTESHDKYVPFVGARRPDLLRQTGHLKLEGESSFRPEYTDVFKEHLHSQRQGPKVPEIHLKPGGDFYARTESTDFFASPRANERKLLVDLAQSIEDEEEKRRKEEEERSRLQKEEEMRMLVSKLEDLKTPPLEIPEYKASYKDFPRERPKLVKPEDEIGRADGSKVSTSPSHSRFLRKIDQDPEYKSIYVDPTREHLVYRRPPLPMKPAYVASSRSNSRRMEPGCHRADELTSEVRSQYVSYGRIPRAELLRKPTSLHLEGTTYHEPEYKTAYCSRRSYGVPEEPRMQRRPDRSDSSCRKQDNHWINKDNRETFGRINAGDDQDAFQVLSTRVHEESVVGLPPPGSRRGSRSSYRRPSATSRLDTTDRSELVRNRSPSPSYRLHVCNVDDASRGFGERGRRRRSSSIQSIQSIQSSTEKVPPMRNSSPPAPPSPSLSFSPPLSPNIAPPILSIRDRTDGTYSPSFAKPPSSPTGSFTKPRTEGQSFVVLDNAKSECPLVEIDNSSEARRRRRIDQNYNFQENRNNTRLISRPRDRTPPKWMPPWYDSAGTI